MPGPLTRSQILAAADAADEEARLLKVQAVALEEHARLLREAAKKMALTSTPQSDTVNTMNASPVSNQRRSKTALDATHKRHPFVAWLLSRGLTVAEVSKAIGRPRSTVQAWYKAKSDPARRRVPADAAQDIERLFGFPAADWPS